jgi:hypothetical protein
MTTLHAHTFNTRRNSLTMSSRIAPSRGILRSSSYTPGDTSSSSDGSDDSSTINRKDRLAAVRRLPGRPVKPERRNVGKVSRSPRAAPKRGVRGIKGNISFDTKVHVKEFPTIERSQSADFFYDDDEIAEFRYQAHMEACGLDPADFD